MGDVNLPMSGSLAQVFKYWTSWLPGSSNQLGLLNVSLGQSSDAELERQILEDAASYGKQLGRIEDALAVLVRHLDKSKLTEKERGALHDLDRMIEDIADVRDRLKRKPSMQSA